MQNWDTPHVELLEGQIVEMSPQGPLHAGTTQRASDYIKAQLIEQAHVRTPLPVTLSTSEPEPDVAVVLIDRGAYGDHHPTPEEIFLLTILRTKLGGYGPVGKQVLVVPSISPGAAETWERG